MATRLCRRCRVRGPGEPRCRGQISSPAVPATSTLAWPGRARKRVSSSA